MSWQSVFGGLAVIYFTVVVLACVPATIRAVRSFVRGEQTGTLRDERLAAAESDFPEAELRCEELSGHHGAATGVAKWTSNQLEVDASMKTARPALKLVRTTD